MDSYSVSSYLVFSGHVRDACLFDGFQNMLIGSYFYFSITPKWSPADEKNYLNPSHYILLGNRPKVKMLGVTLD